MDRRTFIAGFGSLTAAGAAGIGTGAFTSVSADRAVAVSVSDDSSALLALTAPNSLENGEYATGPQEGGTGQLTLNFDASADVSGTGVNDDAVSRFDSVFRVTNNGTQFVRLGIDKTDFKHPDRWDCYPYGNALNAYPNWDEGYVGPGIGPGGSMAIGVRIDTTVSSTLSGGEIVIKAQG